jgi:hypothetical protein
MPKLGLGLSLPQTKITGFDSDARAYIAAVEAADGQALESSVKNAINTFVVGLKADGIWNSIDASCIMAGARTVAGAIIPLRGNAPTNNNFVIGDYSRTLGLLGDGSTKSLSTGYVSNTFFQQNNHHLSVYVTSAPTSSATTKVFLGNSSAVNSRVFIAKNASDQFSARLASLSTAVNVTGQGTTTGFKGGARSSPTAVIARSAQTNTSTSITSGAIAAGLNISVFAGGASSLCDARMSFYSMGDNLDLALLDTRVTTLMADISSALPAPSEIVVATTENVIVTFGDTSSINYARDGYPASVFYFVSDPADGISFQRLTFNFDQPNIWALVQYSSGEEGGLVIEATNPSTNPLIIPTTGWTYTLGSGPTVTITAA